MSVWPPPCPQFQIPFVLSSICQQIWKTQQCHRTGKGQFSFQSQKAMPKNVQTTAQLHSSHTLANNAQNSASQASTVHEPWTSRCLGKAEEPEIKLTTSIGSSKKLESSRRTSTSDLLTMPKSLTVWITTNCGKWRDGNTKPSDLPPEKSVCRSGSNS